MNNLKKITLLFASFFMINSASAADFGMNFGGSLSGGLFSLMEQKKYFQALTLHRVVAQ